MLLAPVPGVNSGGWPRRSRVRGENLLPLRQHAAVAVGVAVDHRGLCFCCCYIAVALYQCSVTT